MTGRQLFLPIVFLASTASFCAAKEKPTVCVSVDSEQETLKPSLDSFEKTAIKQVRNSR